VLITWIFLKAKYKQYQYVGASVVIIGIVIALIPALMPQSGGSDPAQTIAIWSSVLVLSCVPMCLSSVYKEKALGDTEIDPSVWQRMCTLFKLRTTASLAFCSLS